MPTNKSAIDIVTRTLAIMAILCVLTVCVIAYRGTQIPPELNTITAGLVGAISSMLVKTTPTDEKSKDLTPDPSADPPTPVTVANIQPIAVTETTKP
jgi:hypothetical protein